MLTAAIALMYFALSGLNVAVFCKNPTDNYFNAGAAVFIFGVALMLTIMSKE